MSIYALPAVIIFDIHHISTHVPFSCFDMTAKNYTNKVIKMTLHIYFNVSLENNILMTG